MQSFAGINGYNWLLFRRTLPSPLLLNRARCGAVGLVGNGGGGIRTRGGFRLAGFQDQSHQPLDHPSRIATGARNGQQLS